jgi:hypothetical protein
MHVIESALSALCCGGCVDSSRTRLLITTYRRGIGSLRTLARPLTGLLKGMVALPPHLERVANHPSRHRHSTLRMALSSTLDPDHDCLGRRVFRNSGGQEH